MYTVATVEKRVEIIVSNTYGSQTLYHVHRHKRRLLIKPYPSHDNY